MTSYIHNILNWLPTRNVLNETQLIFGLPIQKQIYFSDYLLFFKSYLLNDFLGKDYPITNRITWVLLKPNVLIMLFRQGMTAQIHFMTRSWYDILNLWAVFNFIFRFFFFKFLSDDKAMINSRTTELSSCSIIIIYVLLFCTC